MSSITSAETVALTTTVFSVPEVCQLARMSRAAFYKLLHTGDLKAVKRGRRTLITKESLEKFLSGLPEMEVNGGTANGAPVHSGVARKRLS
jgi:excisionase family DNA binding protein